MYIVHLYVCIFHLLYFCNSRVCRQGLSVWFLIFFLPIVCRQGLLPSWPLLGYLCSFLSFCKPLECARQGFLFFLLLLRPGPRSHFWFELPTGMYVWSIQSVPAYSSFSPFSPSLLSSRDPFIYGCLINSPFWCLNWPSLVLLLLSL